MESESENFIIEINGEIFHFSLSILEIKFHDGFCTLDAETLAVRQNECGNQ